MDIGDGATSTRTLGLHAIWLCFAVVLAACSGSNGAPGADTGSIAGTVVDASGAPLAGASVSTTPASTTAQTGTTGTFTLGSIPIGTYTVTASKSGFQSAQLTAVGVAVSSTDQVTITLTPSPNAPGSIAGTVLGRVGTNQPSSPVSGATVCAEGTTGLPCATSQSDGTFALPGAGPGPVFLTVQATGFLQGETTSAVNVAPDGSATGISITLSGSPSATATYVGAARCVTCHSLFDTALTAGWQHSAHATSVDHTLNQLDVTGWPAAPATCAAPNIVNSQVQATEPVSGNQENVLLVRWAANCPGEPEFSMAFDANGNGQVDPGETVIPVQGTQGGIATDGGQCGQGGLLPLTAYNQNVTPALVSTACNASYLGSGPTLAQGYWQQEYLVNIGPGATKPTWVTWNTAGTPQDMLALPLAWNQRTQYWASAPDYNPTQGGTFAKVCAGCHDTGPSLTVDANANVTTYVAGSQSIACERCHGPGSDHVANLNAKSIINPAYITAQAQNEMCGQCHSNAIASTHPAGGFDFPWNNQMTAGRGNFIPGVDQLANFAVLPLYGDPTNYWPGGVFPNLDHMTFIDVTASIHNTNPYQKVTCIGCHDPHGIQGGPTQIAQSNTQTGDKYVFQNNAAVLRNDVMCLSCHATQGDFAAVALADVANYHLSQGGAVQKNGATYSPSSTAQSASETVVANAVVAHMQGQAGMPAYFDPTGSINGQPVGRCSSCHMMKTAWTSNFLFSGPDANGNTADVSGDVSSHSFQVATVQAAALGVPGATSWQSIMPNACGSCHTEYRLGL
jgi:hypothetical protein